MRWDGLSFSLFLRCVLLPLLSVKPPPQSLFLLVDSIDEGLQLGEGEQRSAPGSPRTIAELLASHHEFLPPWLLLICSARRQNKAITKLFTGEHESSRMLRVVGQWKPKRTKRLATNLMILLPLAAYTSGFFRKCWLTAATESFRLLLSMWTPYSQYCFHRHSLFSV